MRRLRELSGLRIPYMRPSVRQVIDPETLEEAVLSAVIKHLALGTVLRRKVFCKYTDKTEKEIFLIYKENSEWSSCKVIYKRKGFLIYEEMRKYLLIYEEAVSHI